MKIGGPPAIDPNRRLDQAYGVKTARPAAETAAGLLDAGSLLKGRVVNIDAAGLLTVDTELGSFKAAAASVLAVGQEFWFEVVQAGTNPLLAEAGKKNAVLNLLRILLPGLLAVDSPLPGSTAAGLSPGDVPDPAQEAVPLRRFLADNAMDGTPDPGKLIKTISRLNLSPPTGTEAEVASRSAAQPLSLFHEVESPALHKLIRLLEAHTVVNQQPAAGSDYLLFPVFFAGEAGRGEWLFSYEQEGGAADPAATTNISFYLAMSRLGDTHLTITCRPNTLNGVLTLSSDDAADHVRRHLPQLVQALKPLADEVVINCRTAQLDCLKTLKDDMTAKAGLERFALVDLKA